MSAEYLSRLKRPELPNLDPAKDNLEVQIVNVMSNGCGNYEGYGITSNGNPVRIDYRGYSRQALPAVCSWIEVPAGKWGKMGYSWDYLYPSRPWDYHVPGGCSITCHPSEGKWSSFAPTRTLSFNVESANTEISRSPITKIHSMIMKQGDKESYRITFSTDVETNIVSQDVHLVACTGEKDLLVEWANFLKESDPDFIIGHDLNFNLAYVCERAKLHSMNFERDYFQRIIVTGWALPKFSFGILKYYQGRGYLNLSLNTDIANSSLFFNFVRKPGEKNCPKVLHGRHRIDLIKCDDAGSFYLEVYGEVEELKTEAKELKKIPEIEEMKNMRSEIDRVKNLRSQMENMKNIRSEIENMRSDIEEMNIRLESKDTKKMRSQIEQMRSEIEVMKNMRTETENVISETKGIKDMKSEIEDAKKMRPEIENIRSEMHKMKEDIKTTTARLEDFLGNFNAKIQDYKSLEDVPHPNIQVLKPEAEVKEVDDNVAYKTTLKCNREVRRFCVKKEVANSFDHLQEKLRSLFPVLTGKEVKVTWVDNDGDEITMSSDEELMVALDVLEGAVYKIYVDVKGEKVVGAGGDEQQNGLDD